MPRITDPDGEGEEDATEEYYAYDQTPFSTRENASQMLFRFEGPELSDLKSRYLWAPVVDLLLSDEKLTAPDEPGDVYWALGDNLNTVRDIARYDPETDTTTIVNHRVFDAFGNITSETNAAVDLLFAFTGRLFDSSTGLQNNLHRWYDPTIGRWLSEDPISFEGADPNLYRYVGNQPTMSTDPLGTIAPVRTLPDGRGIPYYTRRFDQRVLDYYNRIMRNMFFVGSALWDGGVKMVNERLGWLRISPYGISGVDFPGKTGRLCWQEPRLPNTNRVYFPPEWMRLARAIVYTFMTYYRISGFWGGGVYVGPTITGSSMNVGGIPGISIVPEVFYGTDAELAVRVLIHEALHDLGDGVGGLGWGHFHIDPIVPFPSNNSSDFDRFKNFLKACKLEDGTTDVWKAIFDRAGPRPLIQSWYGS